MDYTTQPLKEILKDREIYNIFHTEFLKSEWLNLAGLQNSESSLQDLYRDGTLPTEVLDAIAARLGALSEPDDTADSEI